MLTLAGAGAVSRPQTGFVQPDARHDRDPLPASVLAIDSPQRGSSTHNASLQRRPDGVAPASRRRRTLPVTGAFSQPFPETFTCAESSSGALVVALDHCRRQCGRLVGRHVSAQRLGRDPVHLPASRPDVRPVRRPRERRHAALPGPADSGLLRHDSRPPGRARSSRCPTTASGRRATAPTSSSASTPSRRISRRAAMAPRHVGRSPCGSFTPFSDPKGLLDASYITNGPVYSRLTYYPTGPQIPVDPAIQFGRLLTGADFDVESIRAHGRRHVLGRRGVRSRTCCTSTRAAG